MIDMHHDLLSIIYQCYLRNDYSYIKKWISNYNSDNVSGVIANLYFMNEDEMKEEIGNEKIDVLKMFKISTELCKKMLPDLNILYSIEGCDYIKDTHELEELYKLGLRNILLVWNNPNKYASGNRGEYGLTDLGRKLISKAIELGISIDLSHLNKKSFYDTVEFLRKQKGEGRDVNVIVSHSNCSYLFKHERNLDDEQLMALKDFNPVVGLVSYAPFVGCGNVADLKNKYLMHIEHVVSLLGIESVGVSTDDMGFAVELFDERPEVEIFNYKDVKKELIELLRKRFTLEDIDKILYKNVFEKVFRRS